MSTYHSVGPIVSPDIDVAVDMSGYDVRLVVEHEVARITPNEARQLAAGLLSAADECERRANQ